MRITLQHNRSKQEARELVDGALDKMLNPDLGPMRIENLHKKWDGDKLNFTVTAKMGFMGVPIKGDVLVTDQDYIIDVDIPNILTKLIPEQNIKNGIEAKVKGLLGPSKGPIKS